MQKVFLAAFVALSFFIGLPFQVIAQIRSDIATATAEQTAQNCILATEDGTVCTAAAAGTATKTSISIGFQGIGNRTDSWVAGADSRRAVVSDYTGGLNSVGINVVFKKSFNANEVDQYLEGVTNAGEGKIRVSFGVTGTRIANWQQTSKFGLANNNQSSFLDELTQRSEGVNYDHMDGLSKLAFDTYALWPAVVYNPSDSLFYYTNTYFSYGSSPKSQSGTQVNRARGFVWDMHTALSFKDKAFFGLSAKYHTAKFKRSIIFNESVVENTAFNDWVGDGPLNAPGRGIGYTNTEELNSNGWSFSASGLYRVAGFRFGAWVETPVLWHHSSNWDLSLVNYTSLSTDPQTGSPMKAVYQGSLSGKGFKYNWSGPLKGGAGVGYVNPNHIVVQANIEARNYYAFSRYDKTYSSEFFRTSQLEVVGSGNVEAIFGNFRLTAEGGYTRSLVSEERRNFANLYGKSTSYNPDRYYAGIGGGLRFNVWSLYLNGRYSQHQTLWVPYYSQNNNPTVVNTIGMFKATITLNFFLSGSDSNW